MRKLGIGMLAGVAVLGMVSLSSAADVKINGKVDVRQEIGGLSAATDASGNLSKTGYNIKAFNLREARLTAKAKITDTISAQISNNFCASTLSNLTLEATNTNIGNTYINMAVGGGNLLVGATTIPGIAIRETIVNKQCLGFGLTADNVNQVCYTGKADVVSYAIAVVDGSYANGTVAGATAAGNLNNASISKDAIINVGADVSGVKLGATYNFDSNDDDTIKNSFFAVNAGYALNPVDLTVQYIGGLDATVVGATDISDATANAPKNEIVLDVAYKLNDKHSLSIGYDMFGKSNAITLKSNCKIADGVSCILRADVLGSDYKKVAPDANNISLGLVAEF